MRKVKYLNAQPLFAWRIMGIYSKALWRPEANFSPEANFDDK